MLKTVIFDLDGTLLNTIGDLAGAGNHVCAQRGWPSHTEAEFRGMVGYGIPNLVEKFTPEECRDEATLAAALAEFQRYYGAHQRDRTVPYDGVPAMLAALKGRGLRLAVYSNKADEFSRSLAEHFFPGTFDAILGKRPGIPGKPDPAGLRLLLAELGAAPEESILVGDGETDVRSARNAGLRYLGLPQPGEPGKGGPRRPGGPPGGAAGAPGRPGIKRERTAPWGGPFLRVYR